MNWSKLGALVVIVLLFAQCKEEVPLPKPKAMLRLSYPVPPLQTVQANNFSFEYNANAILETETTTGASLRYPDMKGVVFLTYQPVRGNVEALIDNTKRLAYEHASKAENIVAQPYIDEEHKVYGAMYTIIGDAASQSQFYVTDSLAHLVTGSLYFYAKPNYDSILPAAAYIQQDMRVLMESLRWK